MKIGQHLTRIGKYKLLLDSIPSTQSYALEVLRSGHYVHGTLILARHQTAGKGRSDRQWQSEHGQNITASFILSHQNRLLGIEHGFISMIASLAVCHTIQHFIPTPVSIKWPNDVLIHGQKTAGILIANQWRGNNMESSVLGIGININQTEFEGLPNATSLKLAIGQEVEISAVTEMLLTQIDRWYEMLIDNQLKNILTNYQESMFGFGHFIKVHLAEGSHTFNAKIMGVERNGKIIMDVEDIGQRVFDLDEIKIMYKA